VADNAVRRFPLVEVTLGQLSALLSPFLSGRGIGRVEHVDGGLTNTILRVWPADGSSGLLVRIFAGGRAPWEKERKILTRVRASLPVSEVLLANDGNGSLPYPSLVCRWIEGITLNSFRKRTSAVELLTLAEPLGRLVARISGTPAAGDLGLEADWGTPVSSLEALLSLSREQLLRGRARMRLGDALADALWRRLSAEAERFPGLAPDSLVHGDLGGRNILVAPDGDARWRIAGLLDWEAAFTGWALWDVGSLFRYPKRFGEAFRTGFERGYSDAGSPLPAKWWETARLLDATRQVSTLDAEREQPTVFADCRELLALLVQDDG